MRRFLGSVLPTLLLVTALGACGDDEGGSASDDPTPTASGSPTSGPPTKDTADDEIDFELVELITETAAGGESSEGAVPLGDDTAVQEFTAQFRRDALSTRVRDAVAKIDVPDDMLLYGAVVAIGCDAPTSVSVVVSDTGLVITGDKVPSPHMECLAAMTTVALVLVPAAAVS